MPFKLKKSEHNPILAPNPKNEWESLCVLNPGAYYENGTFYLLYRAAGHDEEHYIYCGLAKSTNGFDFTRVQDTPVLSPDRDGVDGGCIEDPRIVKIDGTYYITYASRAFPPGQYWLPEHALCMSYVDTGPSSPSFMRNNRSQTCLAESKDLIHFKKCGRITDSRNDDRDVVLFPEKIGGMYARLSRPLQYVGDAWGCKTPSVFITYSDDISEFDESKAQLLFTSEQPWESAKVGASTPPLRTNAGWLHFYHAVDEHGIYRVGAILMDIDNPLRIIARTRDFIMEPDQPYEISGIYNGCVFPTGAVEVDGTIYIYYGAADKYCCVATCDLQELIDYLLSECAR